MRVSDPMENRRMRVTDPMETGPKRARSSLEDFDNPLKSGEKKKGKRKKDVHEMILEDHRKKPTSPNQDFRIRRPATWRKVTKVRLQ